MTKEDESYNKRNKQNIQDMSLIKINRENNKKKTYLEDLKNFKN